MSDTFTLASRDTVVGPLLEFTGALDSATAPEALTAIQGLTPRTGQLLVLHLAELRFCDSSGLTILLAAHRHALAADATMAWAAVPAHLVRLLALTGLADVFTCYPTIEAARDAWTTAT